MFMTQLYDINIVISGQMCHFDIKGTLNIQYLRIHYKI